MRVDIWSDVVCPWCYIGKRRFEAALARFPDSDRVEVVWRSFQLDPAAPRTLGITNVERLAAKYRVSLDEAQAMLDRVTATAADEGLTYRLDVARPANTFDAHRLLHLAGDRGRRAELEEQLMAACLTRGESVGDAEALVRNAVGAGVDEDEARAVLAGDAYAVAVRADLEEARRLDIHAVPFFVVDQQWGLAGAQPAGTLLAALEQARSAHATLE